MSITAALLSLVMDFEGFSHDAYQDVVGVWTIGYGHTHGVQAGDYVTKQTAKQMLQIELEDYKLEVIRLADKCGYTFTDNQVEALTSFNYNLGYSNLKMLTQNCKRDEKTIGKKLMLYVKAGGKVFNGLVRRRQAEQDMYFNES